MFTEDYRAAFQAGLRDTRSEYASLAKAGYSQWTIAKMAASDAAEYKVQIEGREEDDHQMFLRGCMTAANEIVEREMAD